MTSAATIRKFRPGKLSVAGMEALEFGPGRFMPGLQGTKWGNMFFGVDFRGRLMAVGSHNYANGVYVKAVLFGEGGSLIMV